jgi:hypothetical protein
MDKNLEIIITEMKDIGRYALGQAERIEQYFKGLNGMKEIKNEWRNAHTSAPEDNRTILITWLDDGIYSNPILGFYHPDDEKFYAVPNDLSFPLEVDIWCEIPALPKVKL